MRKGLAPILVLMQLTFTVVGGVNPLDFAAGGLKRTFSVHGPPAEELRLKEIADAEEKGKATEEAVPRRKKVTPDLTLGAHTMKDDQGRDAYSGWWNAMPTSPRHVLAPHRIVSDKTPFDVQFKQTKMPPSPETLVTVHGYLPSKHKDLLPERAKGLIEQGRANLGAQPHQRTSHAVTVGGQANSLNERWRGSVRAAFERERGIQPSHNQAGGRGKARSADAVGPSARSDFDVGFIDHRGDTLVTVRGYDPTQHRHLLSKDVREHMDLLQTREKILGHMPTSTYKLSGVAATHRAAHEETLRLHHHESGSTGDGSSSKLTTEHEGGAGLLPNDRSPSHSPPSVLFEATRAQKPRTKVTLPGYDPVRHGRYLPESVDKALVFQKGRHPFASVPGSIHQVEFNLHQPNVGRVGERMEVPRRPPTDDERRAERAQAARPYPSALSDPDRAQGFIPRTKRKALTAPGDIGTSKAPRPADADADVGAGAGAEAEATSPAAHAGGGSHRLARNRSDVLDPKGKGKGIAEELPQHSGSVVESHVPVRNG